MKKCFKKLVSVAFAIALVTGLGAVPERVKAEETLSNETMETATPIELGGNASCTFNDKSQEAHYFKFTVPQDIGNQWITFTVTNYTSSNMYSDLLDNQGKSIWGEKSFDKQHTYVFLTRTEGAGTWLPSNRILIPGETYYIKTIRSRTTGDVTVSVEGSEDDNWGTYENADPMAVGQWKNGKLEMNDDIDCFSVVLPNDNRKHTFNIMSDNKIKVAFANGNRELLSEVSVDALTTNTTYTVTGKGQTIYMRVQAGDDKVTSANYSLKVTTQKKEISKLTLSKYKKNGKKIVGKTVAGASVKVKVNKKTYTVKSGKSGKFTVKLKQKLKSKNKIKVTVTKQNYTTRTEQFIVK